MRAKDEHPDWCAGGHRCALGEHRSDPQQVGMVVGTRVQTARGRGYVEMRAVLPVPADDAAGRDMARMGIWAVDLILRVVLAGQLGPLRKAYQQLTGVRLR